MTGAFQQSGDHNGVTNVGRIANPSHAGAANPNRNRPNDATMDQPADGDS